MLEPLFGSKCREQVLQYIEANESAYATEIKSFYGMSLDPVQKPIFSQQDSFAASSSSQSSSTGTNRVEVFPGFLGLGDQVGAMALDG